MSAITKLYRKILAALLTMLGFSSTVTGCWAAPEYGVNWNEYGVPSADYKVKGVIKSEADDNPINGISVVLKAEYVYKIGSALTDNSGYFIADAHAAPAVNIIYVELTDIDGKENGLFETKVVEADFTNAVFTGSSGNWNKGAAEIDLGIIKMNPDNSDTE